MKWVARLALLAGVAWLVQALLRNRFEQRTAVRMRASRAEQAASAALEPLGGL